VSLAVSSFFAAAVIPTVLALGANEFPERKGMISGILLFCGNLGAMIFPLIIGWVGQFSHLFYGFLILSILALISAIPRLEQSHQTQIGLVNPVQR
jgi:MFS family permease